MNGPPVKKIIRYTEEEAGLDVGEIFSPRKSIRVARPRQVAMYIVKVLRIDLSYPQIAFLFNKKDHTTVMHAVRKIDQIRSGKDSDYVEGLIRRVMKRLSSDL